MTDDKKYYIDYPSLDTLFLNVNEKVCGWDERLNTISSHISDLVALDSFSGMAASNLKSYFSEIHTICIAAIKMALKEYQCRLALYRSGYYSIDADVYAGIKKQSMADSYKQIETYRSDLGDVEEGIKKLLDDIADIIELANPSMGTLMTDIETIKTDLNTTDANVLDYESSEISNSLSNLSELLDSTINVIQSYIDMNEGVKDYKSNDWQLNTIMSDLAKYMQVSQDYMVENVDEITMAYSTIDEKHEVIKNDIAVEDRKNEGIEEMIVGAGAVLVGVGAIYVTVASGGTSSAVTVPVAIKAAAIVSGGASVTYGAFTFEEGRDEYYYALAGDVDTKECNPLKDVVFQGNEEAYNNFGEFNTTVAGLTTMMYGAYRPNANALPTTVENMKLKDIVKIKPENIYSASQINNLGMTFSGEHLFFYTTLSYGKDQVMESCVKDAVNLLNLSEHEGNVIEGLYKLTTATENFK